MLPRELTEVLQASGESGCSVDCAVAHGVGHAAAAAPGVAPAGVDVDFDHRDLEGAILIHDRSQAENGATLFALHGVDRQKLAENEGVLAAELELHVAIGAGTIGQIRRRVVPVRAHEGRKAHLYRLSCVGNEVDRAHVIGKLWRLLVTGLQTESARSVSG